MAHKKGLGSSKNGRDSNAKRLGVKVFGRDHSVFALVSGTVGFGRRRGKRVVTVAAAE